MGRIDDEGFLFVEGRGDSMIITGGENVRPEEVEAALREHPSIEDAAVVGLPDPEWQQRVVAMIVPVEGQPIDLPGVIDHCSTRLAPHKVPKQMTPVRELPRTASGKLRRGGLPELAADLLQGA